MQLNIYLPDELAAKVRAAEGLNVSAVCQAALRQELEMIEAKEAATTDLEAAAVRLRASHGDWENDLRTQGYAMGARWAKDYAEWAELEALEDEARGVGLDREVTARVDDSIEEYLRALDDVPTIREWNADDPFLAAFADGAVETFQEIQRLM